ncbi:hypothetical protein D3C84_1224590 [compost metagenome]
MLHVLPAALASRMKHSSSDSPTLLDFCTAEQSMTTSAALTDLISAWPCLRRAGPVR